jgi:ABC-type multidrug transport system fused ATPase/permease subunit
VVRADEIHVLKEGRIVESGPFDELAAADGPFAKMLELFYATPEPQPEEV